MIEPRSTMCPCGCGPMTMIGEDVSERLDVIPARFRVLVTRRPKYACRRCSGAVAQARAPEHVVPGGPPTEALIAQVIVAKFGDHLPFYRQAEIYARQGVILDRATLGNWAGRACFHLQPIADHMSKHLASADRVFMDETTAPVLILAAAAQKRASSGRSRRMIAGMAGRVRRLCFSDTRPAAAALTPSDFCAATGGAICNATAMTDMRFSRG